jgi:hypothetical protein
MKVIDKVRELVREVGEQEAERILRENAERPVYNWISAVKRKQIDEPMLECFESGKWQEAGW